MLTTFSAVRPCFGAVLKDKPDETVRSLPLAFEIKDLSTDQITGLRNRGVPPQRWPGTIGYVLHGTDRDYALLNGHDAAIDIARSRGPLGTNELERRLNEKQQVKLGILDYFLSER